MNLPRESNMRTIQIYEPDPGMMYDIETVAQITHVPRHQIIVYYKHGLISPLMDPEAGGWFFNDEAIRLLRQIEELRAAFEVNMQGTRLILGLLNEIERLREELRRRP